MEIRIPDWYEAGFLIVNGFEVSFSPREGYPRQLDAVFQHSTDLERARLDFAGNRGCPILSLREAIKMIARKAADHRRGGE
ncbi:MAG: hypothetical protein PHN92_08160 [Geobacter sp.]|nr:hypothetical protein [Geobacter sp.]